MDKVQRRIEGAVSLISQKEDVVLKAVDVSLCHSWRE
jgi:hypothetical protein